MTAPRFTVIPGGGNVPRELIMQDDPIPFPEVKKLPATRVERADFIAASLDCAAKSVQRGKIDIARRICVTVIKMIDEIEGQKK